jgi:hypothetical protein
VQVLIELSSLTCIDHYCVSAEPYVIFGPKGQETLAQGLPWVFVFID